MIRPPSVVPVHPADLTIPIKQEPLPAFDPEAPPAIDDPPIALDPEAPPEPVAPVEPPPAAEPTAPPEPNFGYGATRKLIEEQHAFLRNECMGKPKASLTRLKFRVDVRPDGRPLARVYSGDKAVRNCVRSLFTFPLDKTPNGAAFEYSLTATSNSLKPVPVDPEKVK